MRRARGSVRRRVASRVALGALVALGCVGPGSRGGDVFQREVPPGPVPWTTAPVHDGPRDFSFAVVTDRTGEHRDAVFESAIAKLDLLLPAFVVSVGDLIEGYTQDELLLASEWSEFQGFVARLRVPFFYAPGNHDYSNPVMARVWRERFGPSYYQFRYKDVLFLVLNSELFSSVGNPGHPVEGPDTQEAQLDFVRRTLEAQRDARWTFVLLHQPLWDRPQPDPGWLRVEEWLGDRNYTVFAGHLHTYTKQVRHDRRFITLATTGGRSRLRGRDRGEFDHVALVQMTDSGPVIANLMLDGIQDENVRTEAVRDLVGRLDRSVAQEPILAPARGFRSGSVRFRVRNEGAAPLDLEGSFEAGPDLTPSPARARVHVPPGGEASVPVSLRAARPLDLGAAAPALAHWRLSSQATDGSPVEIRQESWLLPEAHFACARAPRKVAVDGALGEWPALPFAVRGRPSQQEGAAGPAGGSFRFGVSYDDDYVYVAVDVVDPTPFFDSSLSERRQDGVSVMLDARKDPARSANQGYFGAISSGTMGQLAIAQLVPGEPQADPLFGSLLPKPPDGTLRAARRTPRGYSAELAIPRAFLDERQGGPWSAFRLEISQQDYDAQGSESTTHVWRPSRFGTSDALAVAGSGTFERR